MKQLLLLFSLLAFCLLSYGQHRPKCTTCKNAEFTDVSTIVRHTLPQETKIDTLTSTIDFVAKPAHQVCSVNPVTGALCTVDVPAVMAQSVRKIKRITIIQYVEEIAIEPAMAIRYEAEILTGDCNY